MNLVSEASLPGGHRTLENGLTVRPTDCWQDHFEPGLESRTRISAVLGPGKAREIVINVLLPFAFAWGKLAKEPGLTRKAIALCRSYPKSRVTR